MSNKNFIKKNVDSAWQGTTSRVAGKNAIRCAQMVHSGNRAGPQCNASLLALATESPRGAPSGGRQEFSLSAAPVWLRIPWAYTEKPTVGTTCHSSLLNITNIVR